MNDERSLLAIFIDFENVAQGFKGKTGAFDIKPVLARMVEKGVIVVKRAYANWQRYTKSALAMHEAAIDLIEIPGRKMTGKNSADMRLCVDAMDLCYSKPHINTIVVVSGDSDFSPLVSKLRENNKKVIGLGMRQSTSDLLRDNCDEFIYYEDLVGIPQDSTSQFEGLEDRQRESFSLLLESLEALRRENRDTLWSSMIKETIKRKQPSFNESAYGYRSFSKLLEDAAEHGIVELTRDSADRSYIVTCFGEELNPSDDNDADAPPKRSRRSRKKKSISAQS